MLEFVYTIISLSLIFLLGSVFGERDVIYGYVLIPLMGLVFWLFGWLPDLYVSSIVPLVIGLGIVTFLREQFRIKFSSSGSASSLIWKVMAFMVFLQFALVFVNGITVFQASPIRVEQANTSVLERYTLTNAATTYNGYTTITSIDQLTVGMTLMWTAWNITWAMITGMFDIYPNLVRVFHMNPLVAWVIAAGFYIMLAIEVFVLLMFRTRPPEI